MLFVGDDWAQDHHDVELHGEDGRVLARRRLPEGLDGEVQLHALLAEHALRSWEQLSVEQTAERVVIGIETDRGAWVAALRAAGYQVFTINPMSVARYRERHSTSGAKSDAGDGRARRPGPTRPVGAPAGGRRQHLAEAAKLLAREDLPQPARARCCARRPGAR